LHNVYYSAYFNVKLWKTQKDVIGNKETALVNLGRLQSLNAY